VITSSDVGDDKKEPDALDFVTENLSRMTEGLPELAEKLRALAQQAGRGEEIARALPDDEGSGGGSRRSWRI